MERFVWVCVLVICLGEPQVPQPELCPYVLPSSSREILAESTEINLNNNHNIQKEQDENAKRYGRPFVRYSDEMAKNVLVWEIDPSTFTWTLIIPIWNAPDSRNLFPIEVSDDGVVCLLQEPVSSPATSYNKLPESHRLRLERLNITRALSAAVTIALAQTRAALDNATLFGASALAEVGALYIEVARFQAELDTLTAEAQSLRDLTLTFDLIQPVDAQRVVLKWGFNTFNNSQEQPPQPTGRRHKRSPPEEQLSPFHSPPPARILYVAQTNGVQRTPVETWFGVFPSRGQPIPNPP